MSAPLAYRFGDTSFDPATGELSRPSGSVKLSPQPAKLLAVLLQRAGQLVSREDLRREVWGETVVDFEHGLNFCIKQIRAALEDDAEAPRYIETLRGRGYRFVARVEATAGDGRFASPSRRRIAAAIAAVVFAAVTLSAVLIGRGDEKERALLVALPLETITDDSDGEVFGAGFSEELVTQLGSLDPERLAVVARGTALAYRRSGKTPGEIARALDAQYVLTGAVRRGNGRVRVTVQLIEPQGETTLWTRSYDRAEGDVLAIQREVAQAIAAQIGTTLSPALRARRPVSPAAYEAYVRGRFFWNKRDVHGLARAVAEFQRAVALEPSYVSAWAGLADAYSLLGAWSNPHISRPEAIHRARAAAQRALELDPTRAEAQTALAFVRMHHDWDFRAAEEGFKRAIALNPSYATAHHWYAYDLVAMGRLHDAIASIGRAQQLDPLSVIITRDVGEILYFAGRYEESARECRRALELDPSFHLARTLLAWNYEKLGRRAEAARELRIAGEDILADVVEGKPVDRQRIDSFVRRQSRAFQEPAELAGFFAMVGDVDRAFDYLTRAYEQRSGSLIILHVDRSVESLRRDPRYAILRDRLQLPRL